jgi:hypothetical protein
VRRPGRVPSGSPVIHAENNGVESVVRAGRGADTPIMLNQAPEKGLKHGALGVTVPAAGRSFRAEIRRT